MVDFSRRSILGFASLAALGGCAPVGQRPEGFEARAPVRQVDRVYYEMYATLQDGPYEIPGMDVTQIDPRWFRQEVAFRGPEGEGTIVVDPGARHLYLVMANGRALRYGVGVGREGYGFRGAATIARKAEWPRWTPTPNMIAEDPEKNGPWARGMEGGLHNPLGARALYLYVGSKDTLYRIHGTNEPDSIGHSVSSGCIRLFNHDIIDLYERTPIGARVVVRSAAPPAVAQGRAPRSERAALEEATSPGAMANL
ncbi:MAG TPA: L,D-transpeptidase [Beijerinckiaceae bacterium]|jgi:lipoprotein-anchoring transpeptidase ErfK/SrfK